MPQTGRKRTADHCRGMECPDGCGKIDRTVPENEVLARNVRRTGNAGCRPGYNIIPYLPRCVESLRTQTYENLEILLIDDGSTDETPALCDRLATEDERIRVFHKKNGGPSSARNFGLQQAGGEYVGFVDSDDYVDADMYERLYGAIEKTGMPVAQVGRDESVSRWQRNR